MTSEVARVVRALVVAERDIALLERLRPIGYSAELERLVRCFGRGDERAPQLRYPARCDLVATRRDLDALRRHCERLGEEGFWLAGRIDELRLDAQMVAAVGTRQFGALASARYGERTTPELESLLERWGREVPQESATSLHRSDDGADPESLLSVAAERLRALGVEAKIVVEAELVARAAVTTSGSAVIIRASEPLTHLTARRIAEHEISGHLIPRQNACRRSDVLSCGCAGASEDEEGRALVLEERGGLLATDRRQELVHRHWAARWARSGAQFVEVVRGLEQRGVTLRQRLTIALRAFRGTSGDSEDGRSGATFGGLGRELVYLPAFVRLREAFLGNAALEPFFVSGRASLEYARKHATTGRRDGAHEPKVAAVSSSSQTGTWSDGLSQ